VLALGREAASRSACTLAYAASGISSTFGLFLTADRDEEKRDGDSLEKASGDASGEPAGEPRSAVRRHDREVGLLRQTSEFFDHVSLTHDRRDSEAGRCRSSQALQVFRSVSSLEVEECGSRRRQEDGWCAFAEAETVERGDDPGERDVRGQALGEVPGERKDLLAGRCAVERNEKPLRRCGGAQRCGTALPGTSDERRTFGFLEHLLRDPTEEETTETTAPMGRECDNVGIEGARLPGDAGRDRSMVGRDHGHATGDSRSPEVGSDRFQVPCSRFRSREVWFAVYRFGRRSFEHVEQHELSTTTVRDPGRDRQDLFGETGAIECDEDPVERFRRHTPPPANVVQRRKRLSATMRAASTLATSVVSR